jgi:ribose/xylose/arabinose/galactoside ABC-type transport system permease subunit
MTDVRHRLTNLVGRHLHKHAVAFVLLAICIFLSLDTAQFLTADNITNVLGQVSMIGIIAMGMTMLLVSGNFDLSVGGQVAFIGILSAQVMNSSGLVLGIAVAIAVGLGLGTVNGLIVTKLGVNSLMATLGSGLAFSGLALLCSDSSPISVDSHRLQTIVAAKTLGISTPIIVFAVAIALSAWYLHGTVGGRETYAVGANTDAARYAGVPVTRVRFLPFVFTGGLCALASLILIGQLNSALPDAATTWPLQVIAAAVVGGVSITGGRGSIFMAVIGVLLIGVVNNGFNLENLDTNYQSIFTGVIIVVAVAIDAQLGKRAAAAVTTRGDGESAGPAQPVAASPPAQSAAMSEAAGVR